LESTMAHTAEAPKYQLITPLYVGDEFIPEGELIETDGDFIPNEHMIPLNESAKAAFQVFMDRVNGVTPDLGDIVEAGYRNRPRHEITPIVPHEHHKVEMRETATKAPLTGYDGNTKTMTAPKKSPVKSVGEAEAHGVKQPKKVMGTVVKETQRGI
jgi:hypothetical protein